MPRWNFLEYSQGDRTTAKTFLLSHSQDLYRKKAVSINPVVRKSTERKRGSTVMPGWSFLSALQMALRKHPCLIPLRGIWPFDSFICTVYAQALHHQTSKILVGRKFTIVCWSTFLAMQTHLYSMHSTIKHQICDSLLEVPQYYLGSHHCNHCCTTTVSLLPKLEVRGSEKLSNLFPAVLQLKA